MAGAKTKFKAYFEDISEEELAAFYSKSANHTDMPIELKQNGNQLILGKDYATCRRVTENDKDIQLLNKWFVKK